MRSIVAYICLAAATFEIISLRKLRTKRKKIKNGNSIDVLPNLRIKRRIGPDVFWLSNLSTTGEKHLFQTGHNAIWKWYQTKWLKKPCSFCHKQKNRKNIYMWEKSSYESLVRQQYWLGIIDCERGWWYPFLLCTTNSKWKLAI